MGFSLFELSPQILQSITNLGYAEPTPIQSRAIPEALKGLDIRACAQTGTGKTCAFVIPIIEKLLRNPNHVKPAALILTPTRELAAQVLEVTNNLAKGTRLKTALVLGGANINFQIRELRQHPNIIVATPGRLIDHLDRNTVSLKSIQFLVLDEADRMLDMGFLPSIRRILSILPYQRQTMLFSATFDSQIKQLSQQFLKNPVSIELSPSSTATSANVTQMAYPVSQAQKKALLQAILELGNMTSALIFTKTKFGANKLLRQLQDWGKKASVIHSNRSQTQRQQALQGFKDKRYQILVATDIAARGIDVKDISHVINYDVPRHAEDYVHRIGRTGRAQAVGEAFTLVSPDEEQFLKRIESFIRKPIPRGVIPDFPYDAKPRMFQNSSNQPRAFHERSQQSHQGQGHREPSHSRPHSSGDRPQHSGHSRPSHHSSRDSRPQFNSRFQKSNDRQQGSGNRPESAGSSRPPQHGNRDSRPQFNSRFQKSNDRPHQSGFGKPNRGSGDFRGASESRGSGFGNQPRKEFDRPHQSRNENQSSGFPPRHSQGQGQPPHKKKKSGPFWQRFKRS